MKTPRITHSIGYIDDDLICGTVKNSKATNNKAWIKWASIAACFIIMLAAVVAIAPTMFRGEDPVFPVDSEYVYNVDEGTFSTYIGGEVVSEDKIGSKISDVSVTAGWKDAAGEWISDIEKLRGEVYFINGIPDDIAVALKFIDKGEAVTTTNYYVITHPNAEYNGMVFPDYITENPIRYLEESDMGKSNGWQDFGISGEIRTVTVPVGSTYVYQMYSYYIRNDLSHIYSEEDLPDMLEKLPLWLADVTADGRKSFWYSMSNKLPENITVEATTEITSENGAMRFIKAEYKVLIKDGPNEKEENWVIYFMEEDCVYSAYAVIANENFDFVKSYSETIVKSYQTKQ